MNMYIAEKGLQATKLGSYKLLFETISFLFLMCARQLIYLLIYEKSVKSNQCFKIFNINLCTVIELSNNDNDNNNNNNNNV